MTTLTGANAIAQAIGKVIEAINNPDTKVFCVLGYYGIGKRTALRKEFTKQGITPIEHRYTVIEAMYPLLEKIIEHDSAVHLWGDVFASNLYSPEVWDFFQKLNTKDLTFKGTFILVANDMEFNEQFPIPDLPGVHIRLTNAEMLDILMQENDRNDPRDIARKYRTYVKLNGEDT